MTLCSLKVQVDNLLRRADAACFWLHRFVSFWLQEPLSKDWHALNKDPKLVYSVKTLFGLLVSVL